jgi:hypothetical protein
MFVSWFGPVTSPDTYLTERESYCCLDDIHVFIFPPFLFLGNFLAGIRLLTFMLFFEESSNNVTMVDDKAARCIADPEMGQ